jgi:transposase
MKRNSKTAVAIVAKKKKIEIPLEQKQRSKTIVVSLAGHAKHPAVQCMVDVLNDAWDRCATLGCDLVHGYLHHALQNNLPLPDLESKPWWNFALSFTEKSSTCLRHQEEGLVKSFTDYVADNDIRTTVSADDIRYTETKLSVMKDLFEALGTSEMVSNKNYNNWDTSLAHMGMYLRRKYKIKAKPWATALARRIVSSEPFAFREVHRELLQAKGRAWINDTIKEEVRVRDSFLADSPFCPKQKLKYRYYMLQQMDIAPALTEDDKGYKSFKLIPTHSCGGTLTVTIEGMMLLALLPAIKEAHPDFYNTIRKLPKDRQAKLTSYFRYEDKGRDWKPMGQVRSDGVDLHLLYVKNEPPKPLPDGHKKADYLIDSVTYWDLPTDVIEEQDLTNLVAVDKGYHNFYASVRYTGKLDDKGERVFEKRQVTKKWFDKRSGRVTVRRKQALISKRVVKRGLLVDITKYSLKTADPTAIRNALHARATAYEAIHAFYNNKRVKKLKLAMRIREERAIDEVINYITYGGKATVVFGDCSKTTGFKNSTPGGPLKKMEHKMVKLGLRVCEENECMSTKSSLCCHGHHNKHMPNGQDPVTYKKGKFKNAPERMPSEVLGILICQECGRTWNRDYVGAVNIWDIYLARMTGLPRPARFNLQHITGPIITTEGDIWATPGITPGP